MNTLFLSLEKKKKKGDWRGDNSYGPYLKKGCHDYMSHTEPLSHEGGHYVPGFDSDFIKLPQRAEKPSGPFYQIV